MKKDRLDGHNNKDLCKYKHSLRHKINITRHRSYFRGELKNLDFSLIIDSLNNIKCNCT